MKQPLACSMRATFGIVGVLLLFCSLGCGGREGIAPVSGRLTFNGIPLEDTEIMFSPVDQNVRPSIGICDASGDYSLMFTRTESGGTIGRNRVSILQPMTAGGAPDYSVLRVPPEYGEESELEYVIQAGRNSGVDFDLTLPDDHLGQR